VETDKALREIPKPGAVLEGKYRIERAIAEGGMGVVLEATHLQLEERVAIKVLRPEMLGEGAANASGDVVTRFLREARAAIKIRSEHVVRVFDVGTIDGKVPFIVMELLAGQDLEALLEHSGTLNPTEAIDHVLQACEALAEAHALGIVHRDLKPANLFLTTTAAGVPIVKVLDFGISKVAAGAGHMSMTSTQAVMGSPLYMSPEQMRATRDADARSDIWAMGVILYELIIGKPPFSGETMTQVCAAILQDTPPPMGSLRKDVPPGLDRVVMRCLEKRPADRYSAIAELAAALAPFASLVGQEAARRTARTASFSSSPSLVAAKELSLAPSPESSPGSSAATQVKRDGVGGTSTAWGDERGNAKKSRTPVYAAIGIAVALVALLGVAMMMARPTAQATRDPAVPPSGEIRTGAGTPAAPTATTPPPATASAAPSPSAEPPASAAPIETAAPIASAALKAPATGHATEKPTKKPAAPSPTPAPKPSATAPSTNWNERK